jgi:hypothetical protein
MAERDGVEHVVPVTVNVGSSAGCSDNAFGPSGTGPEPRASYVGGGSGICAQPAPGAKFDRRLQATMADPTRFSSRDQKGRASDHRGVSEALSSLSQVLVRPS